MTGVAVTAAVAHVPGLPAEPDPAELTLPDPAELILPDPAGLTLPADPAADAGRAVDSRADSRAVDSRGAAGPEAEPALDADQAHQLLGRKGLLYKEPATRLALLAVHRALGLAPGRPERDPAGAGTAVVVSSNLGNAATVCEIVGQVRAGGGRDVSPLQAPNASSNVIASSVAIRHGFAGANLTVCSGATGGLDAVRLGALLIRAGRAARVVVVGVEPADEIAVRLLALRGTTKPRAAAAAVILEPAGDVTLGPVRRHAEPEPPEPPEPVAADLTVGDLTRSLGDCYGATGVLAVALAARWLAANAGTVAVRCGDAADGYASTWLSRR